jgi:hypothetical protein
MSTRRRTSLSERSALAGIGALVGILVATHAHADDSAEARLRVAYPMSAPSATTFAGIDITQIAIPDLHLATRDDRIPEQGGITLSFADDHGRARAVVRLAVARDAAGARSFVMRVLRGVSGGLAPSALDEVAFADEGGRGDRFVVATRGNVAYVVDALDGTTPANAIAGLVKRAIAPGAPAFPQAKLALPSTIDRADARGTVVGVTATPGAKVHLHASGGYVTHGRTGDVVHPFAVGPIEVTAIVADALGRVTEARASSIAR